MAENKGQLLATGVLLLSLLVAPNTTSANEPKPIEDVKAKLLYPAVTIKQGEIPKLNSVNLDGETYKYLAETKRKYVIVTSPSAGVVRKPYLKRFKTTKKQGTVLEYTSVTSHKRGKYYQVGGTDWVSEKDVETLDTSKNDVGISVLDGLTLTSYTTIPGYVSTGNKDVYYKITGRSNQKQDIEQGYATLTFYNEEEGTFHVEHIPLDKQGYASATIRGSEATFVGATEVYHINYTAIMNSADTKLKSIYDRLSTGNRLLMQTGARPSKEHTYSGIKAYTSFEGAFIYNSMDVDLYNTDLKDITRGITQGLTTDYEKADAIYRWVVNNIAYDYTTLNTRGAVYYTSNDALTKRLAQCTGYANLFAAMARTVGIDTVILNGDVYSEDGTTFVGRHAWNMVKLDGVTYYVDTTFGDTGSAPNMTYLSKTLWSTHKNITFTYSP